MSSDVLVDGMPASMFLVGLIMFNADARGSLPSDLVGGLVDSAVAVSDYGWIDSWEDSYEGGSNNRAFEDFDQNG